MESLVNQPYYSYCGAGLLFPTQANAATSCMNPQDAFLRHQAIDIYNLRPRNVAEVLSAKDSNPSLLQQAAAESGMQLQEAGNPLKTGRKSSSNRSRTAYSKRLLVNARERERMKTLNKGFENLRNALPCYIADGHISKITTLRLAINYIKTLTDVLNDTNQDSNMQNFVASTAGLLQPLNTEQVMMEVYHAGESMMKCDNISTVLAAKTYAGQTL